MAHHHGSVKLAAENPWRLRQRHALTCGIGCIFSRSASYHHRMRSMACKKAAYRRIVNGCGFHRQWRPRGRRHHRRAQNVSAHMALSRSGTRRNVWRNHRSVKKA